MLTAGGDCPGLNAAIRALVTRVSAEGHEVVGIEDGWRGLMEGLVSPLGRDEVRGILTRGGTILGTSRVDPFVHGDGFESIRSEVERDQLDALVVIGGDGSLRTAARIRADARKKGSSLRVLGVPKTIDNDIGSTDVTFGFHTAVQIVTDAIDRLTTTAESHNRVMIVEVMGRSAGWIATYAGMAGGAEAILVPELEYDLAELAGRLRQRHIEGHNYSIVVVAEGTPDPDGSPMHVGLDDFGFERLGGIGSVIAQRLEALTDFEVRVMNLGYLQRGGTPTAFDRILATRMGVAAGEFAMAGYDGVMVALRADEIVPVDLEEACRSPRVVDPVRYSEAAWFFA